jgi:hypothetical protein
VAKLAKFRTGRLTRQLATPLKLVRKLFRAAALIQDTFYAVRGLAFDLNVFKMVRTENWKLHMFERPPKKSAPTEPAGVWADSDPITKRAVLAYSDGSDNCTDP